MSAKTTTDNLEWEQPNPSTSKRATEKEQLLLQCRATVEFSFGSICDRLDEVLEANGVKRAVIDALKSTTRHFGNQAIRHIENHSQNYNISRKHEKDRINKSRVLKRAQEGDSNGNHPSSP